MSPADRILTALEVADKVAKLAVPIAERVAGVVGRGGPRWHRWRTLRLRLRAVRVLREGRVTQARDLRTRAAIHLAHAMRLDPAVRPGNTCDPDDARTLLDLLAGREPLEGMGT